MDYASFGECGQVFACPARRADLDGGRLAAPVANNANGSGGDPGRVSRDAIHPSDLQPVIDPLQLLLLLGGQGPVARQALELVHARCSGFLRVRHFSPPDLQRDGLALPIANDPNRLGAHPAVRVLPRFAPVDEAT